MEGTVGEISSLPQALGFSPGGGTEGSRLSLGWEKSSFNCQETEEQEGRC
jgi:hypothetical protein